MTETILDPSELLLLLKSETGLGRLEALALAGYKEESPNKDKNQHNFSLKNNAEKLTGANAEKQGAAAYLRPPAYLKIRKISGSSDDTAGAGTQQNELSAQLAPVQFHGDSSTLNAFDPTCAALRAPALRRTAELASAILVNDSKARARHWLHALSRAKTPDAKDIGGTETEAGDVVLIEDYSTLTGPWWNDIESAANLLCRYLGSSRVRRLSILPKDSFSAFAAAIESLQLNAGTTLLVLSPMGIGGGNHTARQWQRCLREWKRYGVKICAWSPAPVSESVLLRGYLDLYNCWEPLVVDEAEGKKADIQAALLSCLSTVQWCSPELLRYWRRVFGGSLMDEYKIWHHPDVWRDSYCCGLKNNIGDNRLNLKQFDLAQRQHIAHASENLRSDIANVVRVEEAMIGVDIGIVDPEVAHGHRRKLVSYAFGSENLGDRLVVDPFYQIWLCQLAQRQGVNFWKTHPQMQVLCEEALRLHSGNSSVVALGPGMQSRSTPGTKGSLVDISLRGPQMHFEVSNVNSHALSIHKFENTDEVRMSQLNSVNKRPAVLYPPCELDMQSTNDAFMLSGQHQSIELSKLHKPDWTTRIEQSSAGLIATLDDDRQLQWCASGGEYERFLKGSPGAWIDRDQLKDITYTDSGLDRIAFRAGKKDNPYRQRLVELDGSANHTIALCWIPPGEFTMGSPQSEVGRYEDEQQHSVIISRGFWMMETACTQQLWQAVMKENPSELKGENRPVESVSWEEVVDKFTPALNRQIPELQFRLPTEAEWEYACRAGSDDAFSFGDSLSVEDARYLGHVAGVKNFLEDEETQRNVEQAFGPNPTDESWAQWLRVPLAAIQAARNDDEGYFKANEGTCEVKMLEPNRWGLYQMHGNVWEWCLDAVEGSLPVPLKDMTRVDPILESTGRGRVVRGGSWGNRGSILRSAIRYRFPAGDRGNDLGFRLVTSLRPGAAQSKGGAASLEADGAERKSRRARSLGIDKAKKQ